MNHKKAILSFLLVIISTSVRTIAPELGVAIDQITGWILSSAVVGGAGLLLVSEPVTKK